MILRMCFFVSLALVIAHAEDRQAPKKTTAQKKTAVPAALTLPAGARQIEPGTYTYTDAQGKKWIYRQTPFGLARAEDKPAERPATPVTGPTTTATEDGDTVRFERPGPFGTYRWQKKKTDLDEDERAAWERSRGKDATEAKAKQD